MKYMRVSAVIIVSPSFGEVVCDKNGIGGGGEYFGDNDAQLGRINVFFYH
jgi:hypothetical protein